MRLLCRWTALAVHSSPSHTYTPSRTTTGRRSPQRSSQQLLLHPNHTRLPTFLLLLLRALVLSVALLVATANGSPAAPSVLNPLNELVGVPVGVPGPLLFVSQANPQEGNVNAICFGSATLIPGGLPGGAKHDIVVGLPGQDQHSFYFRPFPGPRQVWRFLIDGPLTWSPCPLVPATTSATASSTTSYAPFGHSAVRNGSQLIVFGGVDMAAAPTSTGAIPAANTLFHIDPLRCTFTQLHSPSARQPPGRFFHSAVLWESPVSGPQMFVTGGCALYTRSCTSGCASGGLDYAPALDLWRLDVQTLEWTQLQPAAPTSALPAALPATRYSSVAGLSLDPANNNSPVLSVFLGSDLTIAVGGGQPNSTGECLIAGGVLRDSYQLNLTDTGTDAAPQLRWQALPLAPFALDPPIMPPGYSTRGNLLLTLQDRTYGFGHMDGSLESPGIWMLIEVPPGPRPAAEATFPGMRYINWHDQSLVLFGSPELQTTIIDALSNSNESVVWSNTVSLLTPFNDSNCILPPGPSAANSSAPAFNSTSLHTATAFFASWGRFTATTGLSSPLSVYAFPIGAFFSSGTLVVVTLPDNSPGQFFEPTWLFEPDK